MKYLKVKSPKNNYDITVGHIEDGIAHFYINNKRIFQEADHLGFDLALQNEVEKTRFIVFKVQGGTRYKIRTSDFLEKAWVYPRKDDDVAPSHVFAPKLVVSRDWMREQNQEFTEEEDLQTLIEAVQ